jgi:hypothetical protein
MPKYTVIAYERWDVRSEYWHVNAQSAALAVARCVAGEESYEKHEPCDDNGTWIETIDVVDETRDVSVPKSEWGPQPHGPIDPDPLIDQLNEVLAWLLSADMGDHQIAKNVRQTLIDTGHLEA